MKILVIGVSGFIGMELARSLVQSGHDVIGLTRDPDRVKSKPLSRIRLGQWDGTNGAGLQGFLQEIDGVVNLTGENIGKSRWTDARKLKLIGSRISITGVLSEAMIRWAPRSAFLIQGSAAGYYGPHPDGYVDESAPAGRGFLAELADNWESAAKPLSESGRRVVFLRTGIVLGNNGGIMDRLLLPFKFYSGAILGSGRQAVSWIHIEDEVRAIRFLMENQECSGPYNLVSPTPSTMHDLVRAISRATGKPAWIRVPGWALKAVFGKMADETVLASQQLIPQKLLEQGFNFLHTDLDLAIKKLLTSPGS